MANLVFYDFETCSSNVSYGQIIQAAAVLVNDNFEELDRYEGRCKLSPGIIPEAMALIVNKTSPKILKETNLVISIEAATTDCWKKYVGKDGLSFGIDTFGKSAPFKDIYKHFGLTVENISKKTIKLIRN